MGRIEFDYWKDVRNSAVAAIFDDSVRPVADAGWSTSSTPAIMFATSSA